MDVFDIDVDPDLCSRPRVSQIDIPDTTPYSTRLHCYRPVPSNQLIESEPWMLRLGSPGEKELDMLPGNISGVPPKFHYHLFCYIDWKEEAQIQKQTALRSSI
jgi:hypothetical protein